jgi:hypothetical protein
MVTMCRTCHHEYAQLDAYGMHKHGAGTAGWLQHSHLGGASAHEHDTETGFQVQPAGDTGMSVNCQDWLNNVSAERTAENVQPWQYEDEAIRPEESK